MINTTERTAAAHQTDNTLTVGRTKMAKPEEVLEKAVVAYKNRTKLSDFPDVLAIYDINSVFQTEEGQDFHSYWCGQL